MNKDFNENKEKYVDSFSDKGLSDKLSNSSFSKSFLIKVHILWEVLKSPATPLTVKLGIIAVLGYFICPIDLIPDFIPVLGHSDDLALIVAELAYIASYITPEIERKVYSRFSQ
ncbi:YkvA family protein [Dethiosulfovibrio salsuginis]|uniref:DUF1232 domain-containing protein n=1 Tax=Dethiosulfovibrio salsuginis TaxID=561720 RepID=A0A1X7LG01_9BACT|nr:YkvA family protein [Dethiosulfovibrio salsuginis]SMG52620.1 Protein of unknown function [Dethiosulfovibrio salsuginis]